MYINEITTLEEFPLEKLQYPKHISLYMDHLESLNIAVALTNNQELIFDNNNERIGLNVYNERRLIDFGKLFVTSCVPDNFDNL